MTVKDTYEERIVAYVDILGWSEACKKPSEFGRLENSVRKIKKHARSFSPETKQRMRANGFPIPPVDFSFFSDCFAISAPVNDGQRVFEIVSWASHFLLSEDRFSVRGGVAIGHLYHHQDIIFGPALLEAVKIERKEAHYPRLLCSNELDRFLKGTDYMEKVVLRDYDEDLVVNIAHGDKFLTRKILMTIISKELSESENFAHRCKWQYLLKTIPKMYEAKF